MISIIKGAYKTHHPADNMIYDAALPVKYAVQMYTLWAHDDIMTWKLFPLYLPLCEGNPPVTGGFPSQRACGADLWCFLRCTSVNKRLTHWSRATHICVSKLTIIDSDKGLSPGRCQAIIWTNDGILLVGPLRTNFSEILIEIYTFSLKKIYLKMSSG